jgi:hypothetical protein
MLLFSAAFCACTDDLDILQSYEYEIEILPLPKSLEKGETVALEFSIVRKGYYTGTSYKFRYFQSEGKGKLTGYYGDDIPMNRFQNILSDNFVLYYESRCEEQQQLDFVFEDNFGQRVEYTVTFGNRKSVDERDDKPESPQPDPDDDPLDEPHDGTPPDEREEPAPDDTPENPQPNPDDEPEEKPDDTPENPQPSPDDAETEQGDTPDRPEDETGTDGKPDENPDNSTSPGEETEADPDGETGNDESVGTETGVTSETEPE